MALLQDKTQETLIQTAHTCTPKVYRHSRSCHTHSHTLSSFRKSARKFILCFWCPSLFRDLLPLPEEPLMLRCFPEIMWFLRTQPYTKCWRKKTKKKQPGAPAVSMKPADQVNPGETLILRSAHPINRLPPLRIWKGWSRIFEPRDDSHRWIVSKQVQVNTTVTKAARCKRYTDICVGDILKTLITNSGGTAAPT